jgi:biotin operon repressor
MAITTDLMDKPPEDRPRDTSRKLKELRREMATIDIRKVKWLLESTALTQVQIAEMLGASTVAINKWAKRLQKSEMSGVEPDATTAILLEQYVEALNPDQRQKYEDRKRRMREAPSEVKVSYLPNHPNYAPLEPVVSAMDEVAVTAEAPVLTEPEPVPTEELRAEDETTTSNPSISISLGGASTDRIADFLECFMLQLEKGKTYRFEISASEE